MSAEDLTVDFNRISKHLGFRVSSNRLRKYEFTRLKRGKTDPWVMLFLHGGSNFRVLERYLGATTPDDAWAELASKMPEYEKRKEAVEGAAAS